MFPFLYPPISLCLLHLLLLPLRHLIPTLTYHLYKISSSSSLHFYRNCRHYLPLLICLNLFPPSLESSATSMQIAMKDTALFIIMINNLSNNNLPLLQWNCHGILNKRETLIQIANQYDILALSETWLSPNKYLFLNDYHILRHDGSSNKSGGVLLAIKNTIPFAKLDSIFTLDGVLEAVGMRIPSLNNHAYIISIYRHPVRHDASVWDRLFDSIFTTSQIIVTGDFNVHPSLHGNAPSFLGL